MNTIKEVLDNNITGLHYGNRIILPFKAHLLKVIVDKYIITDFSISSKGIFVREKEDFMDIYFIEYRELREIVSKYEAIKLIVVEKGKDVFNFDHHHSLACYLEDKHILKIEKTDQDILFIE